MKILRDLWILCGVLGALFILRFWDVTVPLIIAGAIIYKRNFKQGKDHE